MSGSENGGVGPLTSLNGVGLRMLCTLYCGTVKEQRDMVRAWPATYLRLLAADLVRTDDATGSYVVTKRAVCFLRAVEALPLPVAITEWRMQ